MSSTVDVVENVHIRVNKEIKAAYRSRIGSSQYLDVNMRLHIATSVSLIGPFDKNPTQNHKKPFTPHFDTSAVQAVTP